jgi:hypothetical protein
MTAPEVSLDGSVGTSTRGRATGQRVLLVRDTTPGWWILCLEPPWDRFSWGESRFSFDNYIDDDAAIEAMLLEWGVVWTPRDQDDAVEREVFDMPAETPPVQGSRRGHIRPRVVGSVPLS